MKSIIKTVALMMWMVAPMVVVANSAQAGCWKECVLYNPITGRCVEKVKVCDLSDPGGAIDSSIRASGKQLSGGFRKITEHWHTVYGDIFPNKYRRIINANAFTIVGASLGGLEGAAFGKAIDRLVASYKAKDRQIRNDPGLRGWKKQLAEELNMRHVAERADAATKCSANSIRQTEIALDRLFNTGIQCIKGSENFAAGHRCIAKFKLDAAHAILDCHAAF